MDKIDFGNIVHVDINENNLIEYPIDIFDDTKNPQVIYYNDKFLIIDIHEKYRNEKLTRENYDLCYKICYDSQEYIDLIKNGNMFINFGTSQIEIDKNKFIDNAIELNKGIKYKTINNEIKRGKLFIMLSMP